MNKFKKGLIASVLSLGLVMSFVNISIAEESMNGMNMGTPSAASQSVQHEATPGMEPDMPGMVGMEGTSTSEDGHGHGHSEESEGVNWAIVGGFLAVNLLIIGTAGVLKFTQKPKLEY